MKKFILRHRLACSVLVAAALCGAALFVFLPRQNAQDQTGRFSKADAVTRDLRDGSKGLTRVNVATADDREAVAKYGRIVADYGSFVTLAADKGRNLSGLKLENQPVEMTIHLPGKSFDPVTDAPARSISEAGGPGYYIVQFGGIAKDEWLDSLRSEGVEILQYVPHNAFFVYAE